MNANANMHASIRTALVLISRPFAHNATQTLQHTKAILPMGRDENEHDHARGGYLTWWFSPGFTAIAFSRQVRHSGLACCLTVMALAQDSHLVPLTRSLPRFDDCPYVIVNITRQIIDLVSCRNHVLNPQSRIALRFVHIDQYLVYWM